jgi:hypothetical protein
MYLFIKLGTNSLFADGSSLAMWLAGVVPDFWVNKNGLSTEDIEIKKEKLLFQQTNVLKAAVRNFYESFLWLGLLDDFNRSLDLLEYQLGIPYVKIAAKSVNIRNANNHPNATTLEKQVIKRANPMDVALYEYVSAIMKFRLSLFEKYKSIGKDVPECSEQHLGSSQYFFPFFFNGTQIWPIEKNSTSS